MAREVLSNGVIVPEKYTRDWFDDFRTNLVKLNDAITAIAGKQNALTQEQLDAVNSAITSQKVTAYDDHIADTSKHLTDGTASKAIADEDGTSIKTGYVNVAGDQTVTGDKSFTGSNTFNNILPNATNTYSLGSSSYQWSSVYAQSYYYNGTAWGLDKENAWAGNNRFVKNASLSSVSTLSDNTVAFSANSNTIFFNTRGGTNYPSYGTFLNASYGSGTSLDRFGQLTLVRSTDKKGDTNDGYIPDTSFKLMRINPHYLSVDFVEAIRIRNDSANSYNYVAPITTGVTDLGTSTNKWKSLNGINPGALSLPDASNSVNIDTTGWVTNGSTWNTITSSKLIDGYLYINYAQCSADDYIAVRLRTSGSQNPTFCVPANTTAAGNHYLYVCVPVSKLFYVFLEIKTTGTLQKACIFPMLGNV